MQSPTGVIKIGQALLALVSQMLLFKYGFKWAVMGMIRCGFGFDLILVLILIWFWFEFAIWKWTSDQTLPLWEIYKTHILLKIREETSLNFNQNSCKYWDMGDILGVLFGGKWKEFRNIIGGFWRKMKRVSKHYSNSCKYWDMGDFWRKMKRVLKHYSRFQNIIPGQLLLLGTN